MKMNITGVWERKPEDALYLDFNQDGDSWDIVVRDADGDVLNSLLRISARGVYFYPDIDEELGIALVVEDKLAITNKLE